MIKPMEKSSLHHTKLMLLIDDDESQIMKLDIFLHECMSTDDEIQVSCTHHEFGLVFACL